jgi:hypothetical protein
MRDEYEPRVGEWYQNREVGQTFEVVAVDDETGSIEIQYYDGEVAELDLDTWNEMDLELAAPPEDWAAPFDDVEKDERGYDSLRPEDWSGPLSTLEPED